MSLKSLVLPALVCSLATAAGATTLTFSGTVSTGLGSIASGALLSGQMSYDETATARAGGTSTQAVFDAVTAMNFAIGGFGSTFANAAGGPEIQIDNGNGVFNDRFGLTSRVSDGLGASVLDGTYTLTGFSFRLDDSTDTVYSDALDLPDTVDFADFTSGLFFLFFTDGSQNGLTVVGDMTGVRTVAPIPLPAGLPLLLGGLAMIGFVRSRRRQE